MQCSKCGKVPKESDQYVWRCNSCKKAYKISLKNIQSLAEKKHSGITKSLLSCKECGASLDDGSETIAWKCSCGNVETGNLKDFTEESREDRKENSLQNNEQIKEKKRINKKLLLIPIAVAAILCVICAAKLISNNGNPVNQVIKLVETDYGRGLNITAVYYNEKQNGYIIRFTSRGISEKMADTSLSDRERQKYAIQAIEYPYDSFWVYNLLMNGTDGSDWEKVQ